MHDAEEGEDAYLEFEDDEDEGDSDYMLAEDEIEEEFDEEIGEEEEEDEDEDEDAGEEEGVQAGGITIRGALSCLSSGMIRAVLMLTLYLDTNRAHAHALAPRSGSASLGPRRTGARDSAEQPLSRTHCATLRHRQQRRRR